ncbi:MAG: glycoside hydrolase family 3 protein [Firmicutes bacterium]|nr:glycoside hydrolase family 3 protein [Bacillota bacterium]
MINLKENPFNLSDKDIKWVEETLAGMTFDEKIGQIFCLLGKNPDQEVIEMVEKAKAGGVMFRPAAGREIQKVQRELQKRSKISLLLAANLEGGGSGIAIDGTNYATQMGIAATDDKEMAYRLGLIAGREGRAVGCNWAFAPVIDIDFNCQNPITNTRTYGSDPDRVLRMAKAYMKGLQENGLAVSIKHWPGDGVDGRDQHLVTSVNTLSCEEWDQTYGKVYKGMIDAGARTVMSAHIMQPAYTRKFKPGIQDEEIIPASLAPEINNELLREQLGFNGLIVTDATVMAGFTAVMRRKKAVPYSIAAGCDMFLFTADLGEDIRFMKEGVEEGVLSQERLDEAVTRILALKASLKLHEQQEKGTLVPDEDALEVLKCAEHEQWAEECADKAITLVKDNQQLLPLNKDKHKRILLYIKGDVGGYMDKGGGVSSHFVELMEEEGFEITCHDYSKVHESDLRNPPSYYTDRYDLILYFASLKTASNQTVVRINWGQPMGFDVPKYVEDIPTAFISVDNPYHLQDVPMVKTFINGYTSNKYVVRAMVNKLLGRSEFKGINSVDPYCEYWDASF